MIKIGFVLIGMLLLSSLANAQKYIVRFNNKENSSFSFSNPSAFLSQRAIDRRNRYTIPLDSTDLPITTAYLGSLRALPGVTILNSSKWLNQVSIQVSNTSVLNKISILPFVESTSRIAARSVKNRSYGHAMTGNTFNRKRSGKPAKEKGVTSNFFDYGKTFNQVHLHNGEYLHNIGLRGQGMVIGMLDAGYRNYNTLKAFDSVVANQQVMGTWDFVSNDPAVEDNDAHGMQCFSIIAGNLPGSFIGTAPKAGFYLYRTENTATEYPIEEHDWVCAAERLDSAGGDVISSSLGYFHFDNPELNYSYADMNGNTTVAARGADLAAKKGILVVNAMGNEGDNDWKYLSTPADGDSVLAVGAVTVRGQSASLSSYGPSSDGQIKPDVAAVGYGTWLQNTNNSIGTGNGTSYACPIIAGLATCLWQGFPELNNMTIINAIRQSANRAYTPDDRIGFGIPDVKKALSILLRQVATVNVTSNNCSATIRWTSRDVASMKYQVERKTPTDSVFKKIVELPGTDSVFSIHNYEFTDILTRVESGPISYRIRQIVDTTSGSFMGEYLDTVTINVQPSCALQDQINIFPNPATGKFTIQVGSDESINNLQILVYNISGQTVLKRKAVKPQGTYNYIFDYPKLPTGKYFVCLYNGHDLMKTKELLITN